MKQSNLTTNNRVGSTVTFKVFQTATLFLAIATCTLACKKKNEREQAAGVNTKYGNTAVSSQPLPGGKKNFSVVYGNLDLSGSTWVGLCNLTFNTTDGTVNKTLWAWDSGAEKGKAQYNIHTCTLDGDQGTCNCYTPYGWVTPAALWTAWTGNYTYNTTTKVLSITWTNNGLTESWDVTNPQTNIAKITFKTSSYNITHGRGYGSNAAWSTYKTIGQIPLNTSWPGYRITCKKNAAGVMSVTPTTAGAWYPDVLSTQGWGYSANAVAMHYYNDYSSNPSSDPCGSGTASNLPGIVYHITGPNNSRHIIYGHFCANLTSVANFPCYSGQMHPYAMDQIINDQGALKGFIGIEQQDEPGYSDYTYQLKEFFDNTP